MDGEMIDHRLTVARWMIEEAGGIIISGHRDPDQDSYGSQVALYHILKYNYNKNIVAVRDPMTYSTFDADFREFDFIDNPGVIYPDEVLENQSGDYTFDLFVGVDCSSTDRLPDGVAEIANKCRNQLFFDHHDSVDSDRKFNVVNDSSAPSDTAVLYNFFHKGGYVIPEKAYDALYLGLVGDTGNFSYVADTEVFKLASTFTANMTIDPRKISRSIGSLTMDELICQSTVIRNLHSEVNDKFIYYIDDRYNEVARSFSSINNPIDILTKVKGYEIAMTAYADSGNNDKLRVSLRSSGKYKVNDLAEKFGGGGHELASGCRCDISEVIELKQLIIDRIENEGKTGTDYFTMLDKLIAEESRMRRESQRPASSKE